MSATFPVPPSRLPFVNTEIAGIERGGKPILVSSIWGGEAAGRIFLIDPADGSCEARVIPAGEGGAYMLQTGPDGRLYLGAGRGSLLCYDPARDAIDTLVTGAMSSITWGGCVAGRWVVWAASPMDACVYDLQRGRLQHLLRPADPEPNPAHYGHTVLAAPDGRVVLIMHVPQARLILLDPESGQRQAVVPAEVAGHGWTYGGRFLDSRTLAFFAGDAFLIYSYPDFRLIRRIANPAGAEARMSSCLCGESYYALGLASGPLWRLNAARDAFEPIGSAEHPVAGGVLYGLAGRAICSIDTAGLFRRYELDSGELFERELDSVGPLPVHALCAVPESGCVLGAPFINMRFWRIDTATAAGADLGRAGPGVGQVNQIVWDPLTRRALLSCYTTCTLNAYDPAQPAGFPSNPRTIATVGAGQMRPLALVHDGRHVWMASSPEYGTLGGALSRIDPTDDTGASVRTWRHLVRDQTPNAVLLDLPHRRLLISTEVYADCGSAPPTQTTARLLAFDLDTLAVTRECSPFAGCPKLYLLARLPDGTALGRAENRADRLLVWEPDTGRVREIEAPAAAAHAGFATGPRGELFAALGAAVGRARIAAGRLEFELLAQGRGRFLHLAGNKLWYAVDQQIHALPIG